VSYLFEPELEADTIALRWYQEAALDAIRREFRRGIRRTMVVHATGVGKGLVIAKAARRTVEKGGRALVLVHLGELVNQAANAVERCGIIPGIEKAGAYARAAFDAQAVVGSVASLKGKRLASWPRDHFDLICVDEAHHAPSVSWTDILDHFGRARVVGFTATPDRSDEERVDDLFQTIAHEFDMFAAMTAPDPGPFLSDMRIVRKDIGVDLRDLRPQKGDYSDKDLEARIGPMVADLANAIRQEAGDRPTMIFAPGVKTATAFATALRSIFGDDRADWVSGDDPHRDHKLARFRDGGSQYIACCQLLCEGVDLPRVAAVALCRPTNSRGLLAQMIGRGLRLHPGKDDLKVIDFDWLTATHSLSRPRDLFSRQLRGAEDDAEAVILKHPGLSMLEVIERAKGRAARRELVEIEVRARARDVADLRREEVRPVVAAPPARIPYQARHDAPTEKMVGFLKARGHVGAAGYSRRYAGKLIGIYKAAGPPDREAV
jgi:superfamily II DNA or RNA helicase